MFQKLSYFNIIFSLIYVLVYLKDGTLNSTAGVFMVIIFNWLALRSYQLEDYKWSIWHFAIGLWAIYYAIYILYGLIGILVSAFEYEFVSNDTITFLALSMVFCIGVIFHFVWYLTKH